MDHLACKFVDESNYEVDLTTTSKHEDEDNFSPLTGEIYNDDLDHDLQNVNIQPDDDPILHSLNQAPCTDWHPNLNTIVEETVQDLDLASNGKITLRNNSISTKRLRGHLN